MDKLEDIVKEALELFGGIDDAAELEQVIERAMAQLEGRIALDDLRALMESAGIEDSGTLPEPGALH